MAFEDTIRTTTSRPVAMLFLLFTVSGFTGLIYESLWSHYLMLFLGHAAFAQSFVLIVFMGGVALGAWLASRFTDRTANLLGWYGLVEALIGVFALAFHPVFVWLMDTSLDRVVPALGGPLPVELYKLSVSAALLLFPTILLGMTFPLMSGAVIRRSPTDSVGRSSSGHHLAMLYFTNSIGAAAGALVSAFWLLGALGLAGTMQLAGELNLLLACVVYWYARAPETPTSRVAAASPGHDAQARLLLGAAFVTGAASFIYEIGWIRMLSLVLGSSFQAFELMLSAFITGLALGGWWIRKRIDRLMDPTRFSGYVQLLMGLLALSTVLVYHRSFDWMQWLLGTLGRSDSSYALFNLGSHAIAFAIMLPATVMAGMTLPLFTHVLMRRGHGERSIGLVYAANTIGAIAGVVVAVHVLLPHAGLKLALAIGALLDMMLGALLLLHGSAERLRRVESLGAVAVGSLSVALVAYGTVLDPARLSSGVFRSGRADESGVTIPYYRDGKTSSVALRRKGDLLTVTTNGKPDAGIMLDLGKPAAPDESTMALVVAIPALMKPDVRTIANIGFGSGLTAEVALSLPGVESLDTIEIEPAMVEAGRGFSPRVRRPFEDPRSHMHIEDARTYFARHQQRYDLILSEPSNPWVNGVAGLFSTEFYRDVRRYLREGGLLVQWIQLYELDDRLFASILEALGESFADYAVYETARNADVIVVASPLRPVPRLGALPSAEKEFLWHLRRVGVVGRTDLEVRRVGTKGSLVPLLAFLNAPANSDFRPVLQLEAPRARFERTRALGAIEVITAAPLPVYEMLADPGTAFIEARVPFASSERVAKQNEALEIHEALLSPASPPVGPVASNVLTPLVALRQSRALCGATVEPKVIEQLHWIAERTLPHLAPKPRRELWTDARWLGCDPGKVAPAVAARLALYRAISERDATAMYVQATQMLAAPVHADVGWQRFLLSTAMLGALASERRGDARALWASYADTLYPDKRFPPHVVVLANWGR